MSWIRSILATLYLFLHPGTWKEICDGCKTPISDCVPQEKVNW